jgi:hypothetical protein
MSMALDLANEIGPAPQLPPSLVAIADRVQLIEAVETRVLSRVDHSSLERWRTSLDQAAGEMAAEDNSVPGVANPDERKNILLRLWSGCMTAAKTIALGTRAGPNTEAQRTAGALLFAMKCTNDPIYTAGVVAAPSFKAGRKEQYSLQGIPAGSVVLIERVTAWEV